MARTIEARKTNAYTTVLLIEDGKVIGAWTTTGEDKVWRDYRSPGDLNDWEATAVPKVLPEAWGELLEPHKLIRPDELVVVDDDYAWGECLECGNMIKFGPGKAPQTACPGCGTLHSGDRETAEVVVDYIPPDIEFYAEQDRAARRQDMATKTKLTATIINKTMAPYGIGETIKVLTDTVWQGLSEQVDRYLHDPRAWGPVRVVYRDGDGDEVDINDYI